MVDAPRTNISVAEFRRAYRASGYTASGIVALLEEIEDPDAQLATMQALVSTLPPEPRETLVWAAGSLNSPVDGFVEGVVRDQRQTGSVRRTASEVLALRGTPGWEELVATELVSSGFSSSLRSGAVGTLLYDGQGEQWPVVRDYLRRELKRAKRPGSDPPELGRACAYILRGIPQDQVPDLVALLRGARDHWTADEHRWVQRCWPALLDDLDPTPDWDAAELAAWEQEIGVKRT